MSAAQAQWCAHFPFARRHWRVRGMLLVRLSTLFTSTYSLAGHSSSCTTSDTCPGLRVEIRNIPDRPRRRCCHNTRVLLDQHWSVTALRTWSRTLSRYPRPYLVVRDYHLGFIYHRAIRRQKYASTARFVATTALVAVVDFFTLCGWSHMHRLVIERIAMILLDVTDNDDTIKLALCVFEEHWQRAKTRVADVGVSIATRIAKRRRNKTPHP